MNDPIVTDQGIDQEEAVSSSENSAEISETPGQSTVDHQDPESPGAITAELEQLRKQADHGNRKITELGQTKSLLQQELSSRDARIQALENQIYAVSQQQQASNNTAAEADNYDSYYDQPAATAPTDEKSKLYQQATEELVTEFTKLQGEVNQLKGHRKQVSRSKELVDNFGLTEEDAQAALKYRDSGDDVNFAKVIQLGSVHNRARAEKKQLRNEAIGATRQVATGGASPSGATANSDQQADDILTGKVNQQGVARMLADNPDLLDKLSKQFTIPN
jgi:chromosome segregation ATPase